MHYRINNHAVCVSCGRRSDGLGVGKPGKIGWLCFECGPELAKKALFMSQKELDSLEKLIVCKIADEAGGDLNVPAVEAPAFIGWVLKRFAEVIRAHLDEGNSPF